uniref:Uncharacterized protein n=1 Tax=Magallana gigas TaxID=29159 RepID=A0A8W8J015_MAGGI
MKLLQPGIVAENRMGKFAAIQVKTSRRSPTSRNAQLTCLLCRKRSRRSRLSPPKQKTSSSCRNDGHTGPGHFSVLINFYHNKIYTPSSDVNEVSAFLVLSG